MQMLGKPQVAKEREMTARIEIKGLDKLVKKINKLEQMDTVKAALKNAAIFLAGEMAEYPSQTAANQPPVPYYIRGRGTQTGSRNLGNSEDLGQKWQGAKPRVSNKGFTVVIGTNVSYAPYVQSDEFQARWMKDIGWQTDKTVLEENEDEVTEYLSDAIAKIINS